MTEMKDICLYRCWTHTVNGKPSRAQACYPGNSGFINLSESDIGKTITESLRSASGKLERFQVIRCKYPECI